MSSPGPCSLSQDLLAQTAQLDLLIRGDTVRALADMDAALRDPDFARLDSTDYPYLDLAEFYLAAGRPARAEAQLRAYLAAVPPDLRRSADRRLYAIRGVLAMQRGRLEEAAEAFRIADTHAGSTWLVLQYLGPLHERAGRPDSAIAAYEHYLAPGTPDRFYFDAFLLPAVLQRLGALHEARGDRAAAARYYARFAALWAGADGELQPLVVAARRRAHALGSATPPTART